MREIANGMASNSESPISHFHWVHLSPLILSPLAFIPPPCSRYGLYFSILAWFMQIIFLQNQSPSYHEQSLEPLWRRPADGQSTALGGWKAAKGAGAPGCCLPKGCKGRWEMFKARLLPNVTFQANREPLSDWRHPADGQSTALGGWKAAKGARGSGAAYQNAAKAGKPLKPGYCLTSLSAASREPFWKRPAGFTPPRRSYRATGTNLAAPGTRSPAVGWGRRISENPLI